MHVVRYWPRLWRIVAKRSQCVPMASVASGPDGIARGGIVDNGAQRCGGNATPLGGECDKRATCDFFATFCVVADHLRRTVKVAPSKSCDSHGGKKDLTMSGKKSKVVIEGSNIAAFKSKQETKVMAKAPEPVKPVVANVKPATPQTAPQGVKPGAAPASTAPMAKNTAVAPYVAPAAMSADVGQKVLLQYGQAYEEGVELKDQLQKVETRQRSQLLLLTEAFVKAAKNDKRINLTALNVKSEKPDDVKELRQQLEVAIGLRTVAMNADGTRKFEYADWAKPLFPTAQEKQDDKSAWQAKENFRTNFATQFKKCMGAASTIWERGIQIEIDEGTGQLTISGPKVKEHFSVDTVTLNEKREVLVDDPDGVKRKTKLTKIPSFTELDRMASQKAGKVLKTKTQSTAAGGNSLQTENELRLQVQSITVAIKLAKNPSDEFRDAAEKLKDAIEEMLDNAASHDETLAEGATT